ncbi:SusC/RagA family TonB-linked outer membrane protein [Dysgonomonas termitidis]|uniref:SusC/RagA family TonB-linked outer membrane protein n=1 Tax=Dysgonomonas termitidis TaxID=1516126 RepID=A0ABV9KUS5_9BACT
MRNARIFKSLRLLFLFFLIPALAFSQNISVNGVVKDIAGEPIIGVSVVESGTTNGTITDTDGKFSISVSPQGKLTFSFIGFVMQTVNVSGRNRIDVVLEEDNKMLEEVVVIGYGTQRKEAVTGSVASMRGDIVREVAATNVSTALQGRIAGVEMTQTSSKPGAEMQIRIRGTRSLSADNAPLIVLDGIPFSGSINDVDPNSIKSVDILKDASATAIYGSRGANGVILISTNRGYAGQKAQVSYNAYYGTKSAIRYPMMNGQQFAKLREEAARTIKELGKPDSPFTNSPDESNDINTDWQDMLYRPGTIVNHDISMTKGSEDGSYAFGLGYYLDQAVIPTQQYSRISLRASVDQNFGKYIRFGLSSNSSYGLTSGTQINTGDALASSPLANPYDADGNLKRSVQSSATDNYRIWTKETLKEAKDLWMSDAKSLASYNNIYAEVSAPWIQGLKYRINLGLNVRFGTGGGFTGIGVTSASDPNAPSSASINNSLRTNWAVENLLTYDRTFAEKHQINVVGLYSSEQTHYNRSEVSARDLPADHFQYYDLSKATGEILLPKGGQSYQVSGLTSWMGRVMYSYDNRYMLSATVRADASSRLAPGYQWHTYPAVSVGWNINREAFMEDLKWIDQLKLRAGYGETSNQAVDPYKTLGLLDTRYYNFGEDYSTGYYLSELPNEKLGWEYTTTYNYGLDFSLFNDRLSGTVEYYTQHTKDILLRVNLPSTSGVGSYMANIGETSNKGWEISLNGKILDNLNGWTWEAGINWYTNKNELLKLNSGEDKNEGNWWFKGHPINVVYDYEQIGLWQEGDPYLQILEPGGNAGMIKVKYTGEYDADGKPVRQIGADDRQIIHLDPSWQGGFNTRVAYKDLDLTVVGSFQNGGKLISTLYGGTSYLNMLNGRHGNVNVDYWTPENTGAKYPRPGGITSNDNAKYANSMALFDASYMKVRVITLGYNFRQKWLRDAGIDKLRIYATVQNPFVLFSPYHDETGLDPETNSRGNENQAVTTQLQDRLPIVGYSTPNTRNYLFGINLTF